MKNLFKEFVFFFYFCFFLIISGIGIVVIILQLMPPNNPQNFLSKDILVSEAHAMAKKIQIQGESIIQKLPDFDKKTEAMKLLNQIPSKMTLENSEDGEINMVGVLSLQGHMNKVSKCFEAALQVADANQKRQIQLFIKSSILPLIDRLRNLERNKKI